MATGAAAAAGAAEGRPREARSILAIPPMGVAAEAVTVTGAATAAGAEVAFLALWGFCKQAWLKTREQRTE